MKKLSAILALLFFSGCATPVTHIDTNNDKGKAVMGLDYRDFQTAAGEAVSSMLQSGAVAKPGGGRYVLAISRIVNDTMQRIDTDQLVKKIRVDLLQSGKVVVTTAVGLTGPEDPMAMKSRQLRQSAEFNQSTVAGTGQMIAPDLSLSGKLLQRNIRVSSGTQQVEYYFQLTLTDISTGLALWEGESFIGKRGSSKSVSW
ncbi:penicillin-binding protein activator LpoB [Chlorobium phaeovibrioides]|uniref:Penicillin-binding protein activator LpoB n=2 Tax=Chlorobium phaeovibrioides TaxID=1094 RepID=A0A3S0NIU6_CHLPH|nr:penicillin-binding protein activator LpoB [Chlorobium phaeovibrioides]HCD36885.1 penicillin-binding protein activator LpoB [Chlorobium sp.]KAA6231820.1 penicillin-binding protein activator LpoB [Chlorobium phaeovibrioides]MWV54175.1 penicillin-binding protein activator LpoB [Chlorobium phaeovibrioides]QEQ57621.1 penicillin-binding protein activator LpoB [Chlorobium phaeovibrioides]RTY34621.1 penicillin-binding protein activator LpoB [Chlorobium phaeovibrioides]